VGAAGAYYRGTGAKATGWDVGGVYTIRPSITVAAVLANIGEPDVRGVELPFTLVPGVVVTPAGQTVAVGAHARFTPDSVLGYALSVRWRAGTKAAVEVLARMDTDGELRRSAFAFGVSVGVLDLLGAVATTSGDARRVDAANLYGVVSRPAAGR
jgi:hypothetical protein